MTEDYYTVMGIDKGADQDEVKKAYKKLVLELHPDRTGNDPKATERMKRVNEAYAVLSDKDKRTAYDRGGPAPGFGDENNNWGWGAPGGFSMRDIQDFFEREMHANQRRPHRGANVAVEVVLTLREAFTGCKKDVEFMHDEPCKTCSGTGDKPGTTRAPCARCMGRGFNVVNQGFVQLRMTCSSCGGLGSTRAAACEACKGRGTQQAKRSLNVAFIPGISSGDAVRLTGQGAPGPAGPGDAYVNVVVKPDKRFHRAGADLVTHVELNIAEAALGTTKDVLMPDDSVEHVTFPAGVQPGHEVKMKNKGMPHIDNPKKRGILNAVAHVTVPKNVTDEQRKLLERLAKTL